MPRVKDIRISFVCPAQGELTLAAAIDHVEKGSAFVACPACDGFHRIDPTNQEEVRSALADVVEELESSLDELKTAADDAESHASSIKSHTSDVESHLDALRAVLTGRAAA